MRESNSDVDSDTGSHPFEASQPPADSYSLEIDIKVNAFYASALKSELQDLASLERKVRRVCDASAGKKLVIAWRDKDEKEILIENDEDFRESIDAQTSDGSNDLKFYVTILRKRTLPSSSPSTGSKGSNNNRLLELVRYWCKEGKEEHRSPLYSACEAGDLEGVKALLECTLDMVPRESKFVKKFMKKTIEERINQAEHNGDDSAPLHIAASLGHKEIVNFLIAQRADLEGRDEQNHWTPLHYAVDNEHKDIVSILLAAGADLEATNPSVRTPLHFSAEKECTEIASLLIVQKANLDAINLNGWTPLHCAVHEGEKEAVRNLISHGANIEWRIQCEATPLQIAASNGHADIVKFLINGKADLMAEDSHGLVALETARGDEVKALLRKAMGLKPSAN